jgi:hypothetical protein
LYADASNSCGKRVVSTTAAALTNSPPASMPTGNVTTNELTARTKITGGRCTRHNASRRVARTSP